MTGKILIVDDDIDTLQLVGTMLERQGFKILAANNGEQALLKAASDDPNLIILDVMMPGLDGYEVTRQLRAKANTAHTPILMFSAKAQMDDKIEGFEAGVDDYITKPIHPADLIASVKKLIERPQSGILEMPEDQEIEEIAGADVTAVISAKSGTGVTTLAINYALALRDYVQGQVVLVEFAPGMGDMALYLGLPGDSHRIEELLLKNAVEIRMNDVEASLTQFERGLKVLPSSRNFENIGLSGEVAQFEAIVNQAKRIAPHTVLDLGAGINDVKRKVLQKVDRVIVIVEPSPHVMIHTKQLLADLQTVGVGANRIMPVMMSSQRLELLLPAQKIQQGIGMKLLGVIAPAPEIAFQSIMRQKPLILQESDSITARQIRKLVQTSMNGGEA
jgi:pilus assembly protein CpaE